MTVALAALQQELHDFAADAHPQWFSGDEVTREMLIAHAVLLERARRALDHYFDMTFITRATAGGESDPDWLDGLARELGSYRQEGEGDAALRDRLRSVPAAITRPQILAVVGDFLASRGVVGDVAMEEIPLEAGYCLSTPAVIADAAGFAFCITPSTSAFMSRTASTTPFGFIIIVPAATSDAIITVLRALLVDVKAAGYAALVERAP